MWALNSHFRRKTCKNFESEERGNNLSISAEVDKQQSLTATSPASPRNNNTPNQRPFSARATTTHQTNGLFQRGHQGKKIPASPRNNNTPNQRPFSARAPRQKDLPIQQQPQLHPATHQPHPPPMPAYHSRRTLPLQNPPSQQRYVQAAAAAKLRVASYNNALRQHETHMAVLLQQQKRQRARARQDPNIQLPRDPVQLAKKRAIKATVAAKKQLQREHSRGLRWYDGQENNVVNGADLAKTRSDTKTKQIERRRQQQQALLQQEKRKRKVNLETVLIEAKAILNQTSEEFEAGSYHLLRADGTLHRSVRKQVLERTFGKGVEVGQATHEKAWVPGGNAQATVVCTRGTKKIPERVETLRGLPFETSSVSRPLGYGGAVRLFSV